MKNEVLDEYKNKASNRSSIQLAFQLSSQFSNKVLQIPKISSFKMNSYTKVLVVLAALVAFSCVIMAGQVGNYYISEERLAWDESKEYCEGLGQRLLSISNYEEDLALMNTVYNDDSVNLPGNIWVSGKEVSEGVWTWDSNGLPFYHTRWFVGQPDDTESLNCIYLASTAYFYWRDANCSAPMFFACEP